MMNLHIARSRACDTLSCRLPIVVAGMGGVSRSELVTAAGRAGAFGFLGIVREPTTLIEREVQAVRDAGVEAFGVNIIPAATDSTLLERQIDTIIGLRVPAVCLFWDLDPRIVTRFRDAGITVVYQVGSVEEAIATERAGADIIIAQGVEAGGHVRGTHPLRSLLMATANAVQVPVLAAGGLATGSDLIAAIALGAQGIVLGSAMLATHESFAHEFHKWRLVEADGADTLLTRTFHINWPPDASVRVLKSAVTNGQSSHSSPERMVIGEEEGRPIYLFSTDSPLRSMTGDFASMALYAGTGVGRITTIEPARTRIERIVREANDALARTAPKPIEEPSSGVCYVGEFSGPYMGTIEPDALDAELRALGSELKSLFAKKRPKDDWIAMPDAPWVSWIVALRKQVGTWPLPVKDATSPAEALDRLTGLLPRMAEGSLRQSLLELRTLLEHEAVQDQPLPSI